MDVSSVIAILTLCLSCIMFGYKLGKDVGKKK